MIVMDRLKLFCDEAKKYPLLSADEEKELGRRVRKGDLEAINELTNSNLRLVLNVVKKYKSYTGIGVADISDLVQEGNIGLYKAVLNYDPDLGYKFSTYAYPKIRAAIKRCIEQNSNSVHIPINMVPFLNKARKLLSDDESAKTMSQEELAQKLKTNIKVINNIMSHIKNAVSLESELKNNGNNFNCIQDEKQTDPLVYICQKSSIENFKIFILELESQGKITEKERKAIYLKFGIENGNFYKLKDIAKVLSVSIERSRQIICAGIMKIKKEIDNNEEYRRYFD